MSGSRGLIDRRDLLLWRYKLALIVFRVLRSYFRISASGPRKDSRPILRARHTHIAIWRRAFSVIFANVLPVRYDVNDRLEVSVSVDVLNAVQVRTSRIQLTIFEAVRNFVENVDVVAIGLASSIITNDQRQSALMPQVSEVKVADLSHRWIVRRESDQPRHRVFRRRIVREIVRSIHRPVCFSQILIGACPRHNRRCDETRQQQRTNQAESSMTPR